MSSQFTHLHFHTQYSLLDGALMIKGLPKILQSMDYKACAITDHGNLHGAIEFHDTMKRSGIKPIIGLEAYVAKGERTKRGYPKAGPNAYHTILLCQNREGYNNLIKLCSIGYTEGKFYGKPRIDHEILEKYNKGLFALSACLGGEISKRILEKDEEEARKVAKWYSDVFDDRYYLEIQSHGIPEQNEVNVKLMEIGQELGIPLVGTNDCHYKTPDDAYAHYILQLIGWQKKLSDPNIKQEPVTNQLYIKNEDEMKEAFRDLPEECLKNAAYIADQCEIDLTNKKYYLPDYPVDLGLTLEQQLVKDTNQGLEERFNNLRIIYAWTPETEKKERKRYEKRLEFELKIINEMGFPGYFLIVADFVSWSKDNGVPVGPGRGSGAGSLVAYCLRITDLDPIEYDLLFERFLNPERISMPDFDIDFETEGREKVIDYVREKYGPEKVCQISAIGSLQAKGAIRSVARVLNIPYSDADKISKLIPNELKMTIAKAVDMEPELKRLEDKGSDTEKKLIRIAKSLEGLNSNLSTHAAGVIIMNSDVTDIIPVCTPASGDTIQSQYTMEHAENQGAVKFDFLGLRNLSIIQKCVELIDANRSEGEEPLNLDLIPLDNKESYDLLCKGDTTGVFQLESSGMKSLLQKMKPDCFEDIIALVALYRPGPLGSGMVDDYVECKHGRQEVQYAHPLMESVLKETNGVMVYQEQVMRTVQILAGFTLGEADMLRRAIGKKKEEVLKQQRDLFVQGCKKHSEIEGELSNYIFDLIDKFAGYGFNKSHSAAYALVGYQTAWLKANHPVEFMAALLTTDMNRPDSVVKLIHECREMGIEVLPPDINESDLTFTTHNGKIRFGLNAIKNVGAAALASILAARRKNGHFQTLLDVFMKIDTSKVNSRVLETLVKCGVFDSIDLNRRKIFEGLEQAVSLANAERSFNKQEDQVSMFDMLDQEDQNNTMPQIELPDLPDWDKKKRLKLEKEALGFFISGHPLDPFRREMKSIDKFAEAANLRGEDRKFKPQQQVRLAAIINQNMIKMTKKNDKFSILQVEDLSGSIEVVVFPKAWAEVNEILNTDEPILIKGRVNINEETVSVIASEVQTFSSYRREQTQTIHIDLPNQLEMGQFADLQNLFQDNAGDTKIFLSLETGNQCKVELYLQDKIDLAEEMVDQLQDFIGEGQFYCEYKPSEKKESSYQNNYTP